MEHGNDGRRQVEKRRGERRDATLPAVLPLAQLRE